MIKVTPSGGLIRGFLECLRDIGIDKDLEKVANGAEEHMVHTRWCHSMAGEEYGRIYSWGNDPKRKVSEDFYPTGHNI